MVNTSLQRDCIYDKFIIGQLDLGYHTEERFVNRRFLIRATELPFNPCQGNPLYKLFLGEEEEHDHGHHHHG